MSSDVEIYKKIVFDLVTLAIRANNVIIQGQFKGEIADQVNAVLTMCKEIEEEYVVKEGDSNA